MKLPTYILLVVTIAIAGCSKEPNKPQVSNGRNVTRVYTKGELDKLILVGMSVFELTNRFGAPGSEVQVDENVAILIYSFPIETFLREGGFRLIGFDVTIRDEKVVGWSPVTSESRESIQPPDDPDSFGEQSFEMYVAIDHLTNVANRVDSEGSADASSLNASPDLEFKAKVFGGPSDGEQQGEWTVILVVSEQDASRLKTLTENNIGKRTLLVCRKRVIAAPGVHVPVASRQLMFTVKNPRVLEFLRNP